MKPQYVYVIEAWLDGEPAAVAGALPQRRDAQRQAKQHNADEHGSWVKCEYKVVRYRRDEN